MSALPRSPEMVRGLQERAARALPAEHVDHVGDWWLRGSAGPSWWRGTVLPHGEASHDELVRMIGTAERFYAGLGTATRFQISPGACPADLDALLAERGYRWDGPMSLRTASTAQVRSQARRDGPVARLHEFPTVAWFETWYAVHGHGGDPQLEWDSLGRVTQPSAYVGAVEGDEVIAVGRAVADTGWVGVFGMATLPAARGKGAARSVVASLADWAVAQGADGMYLQVEGDNSPALQLYDRMCFTEACAYHYRTEPPSARAKGPA